MSPQFITRHTSVFQLPGVTRLPLLDSLTFTLVQQLDTLDLAISTRSWPKRRLKRSHRLRPFASITSCFGSANGQHTESIRTTFNKIDRDRKGHITESDLQQYAESRNLPKTYVRPFMDAILQQQQQLGSSSSSSSRGSSSGGSSSGDLETENEVSYSAFKSFVSSREEGLREAFRQFDLDGDGQISPDDLHVSLSRVAICSPATRCVLRTRHEVVEQLLTSLNMDQLKPLSFDQFRSYFMLLPQQEQLVEYWLSGPAAVVCADMGGHFTPLERRRAVGSPWGHLLAGAAAGAASRTATAPLETLRLAAMAGTLPSNVNLLSAGHQLMSAGGVAALYRGNLVNVLRSAPARAVDFFAFDLFKGWLGSETYAKTFAAAGLAGTFSWALLYPLEVVRSRMTLDTLHRYKGLADCIRTMAVQEGPAVFYRGLAPSLAAIAPEAAITYGLHDLLKRGYHKRYRKEPGIGASLLCGVAAAWSGQLVAFPLESVSRRMQLAGVTGVAAAAAAAAGPGTPAVAAAAAGGGTAATAVAAAAPNMGQVFASIVREGGPAALYRGLGAATLRLVPSAMVSFGAYELIRKVLLDLEAQQEVSTCRAKHKQLHKVLSSAQKCNQVVQQLQAQGVEVPPVGPVAAAVCSTCELAKGKSEGLGLKGVPAADGRLQVGSSSSCQGSVQQLQAAVPTAAAAAPPTGCQLVAAAAAAAAGELPATAAGVAAAAAAVDACPAVPVLGVSSSDCKSTR